MRARLILAASACVSVVVGSPAAAADVGSVITMACAVPGSPDLTEQQRRDRLRARLAEAILNQSGMLVSDLITNTAFGRNRLQDSAVAAVRDVGVGTVQGNQILTLRDQLEQALITMQTGPEAERPIIVADPPALGTQRWLFVPAEAPALRCGDQEAPPDPVEVAEKPTPYAPWALREKVEELALVGDDAKGAGAARVSLKRERAETEDGGRKTTTSLSVTGTLGIRLSPLSLGSPVYAYGSYALSRERSDDADPETDESDGDVNALELGLVMAEIPLGQPLVTFRGAYVNDFAKNARRLKFAGTLDPGFSGPLGPLCGLGAFESFGTQDRVFARCQLLFEAEGSRVFEAGETDFKDRGNFGALGGRAVYELGLASGDSMDLIASIGFRYMPTIFGKAPDIKRWDAGLKYRFYTESGIGIDFGIIWARGHEPISYAKEDKIELGFGIIR